MVTTILLILIYLAFISLGLPDSLLGVTWPAMQAQWSLPLDAAGLVSMIITVNTIISSLLSGTINKKLGTGKVTFLSCLMTGLALLGFSISPSYVWLLLFAIPLGFGGGSVDAALNNYVSLHFKAHHMNWLHSFWGLGATMGPIIISQVLLKSNSWQAGYKTISIIQLCLAIVLFFSLPLWKKHGGIQKVNIDNISEGIEKISRKQIFCLPGIKLALLTFMFYCTAEISVGLWGSSFLVKVKKLPIDTAAKWIAIYYGGITIGRFLCGFISLKLTNTQLIRLGVNIALLGTIILALPIPSTALLIPLLLIGLGLSPIFPAMIHETPRRFGSTLSQNIIGYQMASGYMGNSFLAPLIGVILKNTTMTIFPFFIIVSVMIVYYCTEKLKKIN